MDSKLKTALFDYCIALGDDSVVLGHRLSEWCRNGPFLEEDLAFIEKMQASIESAGFQSMPLSYQERRIYHWHEELDRRIGTDRIAENLRAAPVLDAWVTDGWL